MYSFENMDNFKKFSDEKLLDRYEFNRSLNDECISENYYLHEKGDYHDLYFKIDICY